MADADDDATDVFEVVTHPTRTDVLRVLADAQRAAPEHPWLSYSELRARVGSATPGTSTTTSTGWADSS